MPSGPKNGFWKGGRVVDPRGYVLIRVGIKHHLSDCRGYAYEHRLVAERTLGRRLRKGEIPHHKDENKSNNHPSNIEVVRSRAEHRYHHRKFNRGLRKLGERNPMVQCACGCGTLLRRYDGLNRPRRYITSHNPRSAPTIAAVLACLGTGPKSTKELITTIGKGKPATAVCLSKLKKRGVVEQVKHGVWALNRGSHERPH